MKNKVLENKKIILHAITFALIFAIIATGLLAMVLNSRDISWKLTTEDQLSNSNYTNVAWEAIYNFEYTGTYETFVAPKPGVYQFEAWGANGGYNNNDFNGKGGYTAGTIALSAGDTIYVYVGQAGWHAGGNATGFNGGTGTGSGTPGGGATDFRLKSGEWNNISSLSSRIMIAGGGGSYTSGYSSAANSGPGHAGGLVGSSGGNRSNSNAVIAPAEGGSQTGGGKAMGAWASGSFGFGGGGAGGGGGYYGGGGSDANAGGGGGSSFISGHAGCNAISAEVSTESNIVHTNQPNHYSLELYRRK